MKTEIIKEIYNPYGELVEKLPINVSQYCQDIRDAVKYNAKILVEVDTTTITSVNYQYIYK